MKVLVSDLDPSVTFAFKGEDADQCKAVEWLDASAGKTPGWKLLPKAPFLSP